VIIPCFNGRETICRTLDAVCSQVADFEFEVIVIDSSNDGTDRIIQNEFPKVRLIHLNQQTLPGSGRNLGIQNATGELLVFTDADAVPEPDWLKRIADLHQKIETDAVGGSVINGYPHSLTAWVSHLIEFNEWTAHTPAGFVLNNPSVNISYKSQVFSKYKLCFSDIFPSEDTIFNRALVDRGGRIYYDPSVRVIHLSRVGLFTLFRHQLRLGQAAVKARTLSSLPGKIFMKYRWLCVILPPIRWVRASLRLLRYERKQLILFWLLTPLYLGAAAAWAVGFMQRKEFHDPKIWLNGCDWYVPEGNRKGTI
jgi:glycosyltransferase involved in cell wall biosynthesis